jgi:hypothetical protein
MKEYTQSHTTKKNVSREEEQLKRYTNKKLK